LLWAGDPGTLPKRLSDKASTIAEFDMQAVPLNCLLVVVDVFGKEIAILGDISWFCWLY
jgi:hypothetical protein